MLGTKLCDNCWEVERRTGKLPSEIDALQASHDIKTENLEIVRKERDALASMVELIRTQATSMAAFVERSGVWDNGFESGMTEAGRMILSIISMAEGDSKRSATT